MTKKECCVCHKRKHIDLLFPYLIAKRDWLCWVNLVIGWRKGDILWCCRSPHAGWGLEESKPFVDILTGLSVYVE